MRKKNSENYLYIQFLMKTLIDKIKSNKITKHEIR